MTETSKIAKLLVKSVTSGELVAVETFWENSPCVITFLRRFGCVLCRLGARQISAIKPQLDAQGIKLIGIGLEEFGLEEFVEGNYFNGELYIDAQKSCYEALEYKRYNWLTIVPALITKKCRDTLGQTKEEGITGNLKGDGFQTGGALVIAQGGEKVLFNFRQDNVADHPDTKDILISLGIGSVENASEAKPQEACSQETVTN